LLKVSGLDWCWLRRFFESVLRVIYRQDARMGHEYQSNAGGARSDKMHACTIYPYQPLLAIYYFTPSNFSI
jgi:hypothetical protein